MNSKKKNQAPSTPVVIEKDENLDNYEKILTDDFANVGDLVKGLQYKDVNVRHRKLKEAKNMLLRTGRYLDMYKSDLEDKDKAIQDKYEPMLAMQEKVFESLQKKIDEGLTSAHNNDFSKQGIEMTELLGPKKNLNDMTEQELVNRGDEHLDEMEERAKRIKGYLHEAKDMMVEINQEIYRQKEVMQFTIEESQDTQSLLKRSKSMVKYFQKTLQTDKMICCLMITIMLALCVVIVLGMMGKGGGNIDENLLPPINNSDNST